MTPPGPARQRGGFGRPVAALWAAALLATLVLGGPARAQPFEFVALGDMPYQPDWISGPAYRQLIDLINQARPAFSVHVGDFKDGYAACTDALYAEQAAYFQRFDSALVYTPGDNDWLDCQRRGDDPLERLQALRQRFFASPRSLGRRPIAVERQSDAMPEHARYRENLRWQHQGVVFATFHTVGPNNGIDSPLASVRQEAVEREAANRAWIGDAFALARQRGAHALVLLTQADMLVHPDPARRSRVEVARGFAASVGQTLRPLAAAAPFPVLLVHGDSHHYKTDRPFVDDQGRPIANLWRLEVFGEPRLHAVRVRVAAAGASPPFVFTPIWNPLSPDPRRTTR